MGLFTSTGTQVGIERSGNDYWLWQDLGGSYKWYWKLKALTSPSVIHALDAIEIRLSGDVVAAIYGGGTAVEYAIDISGFIGNIHGHDTQSSLTIAVDGQPVTLSNGQSATGSSLVVTRVSALSDPNTSVHNGDATVVYTMSPTTGLNIDVTIAWLISAPDVDAGMMAVADLLDVGYVVHPGGKYWDLLAYVDTQINYDQYTSDAALAFDRDGHAAMLFLPDTARSMGWQDRGVTLNKLYTYKSAASHWAMTYRGMWFSSTSTLLR